MPRSNSHAASLAVALDGTVLVNVAAGSDLRDPARLAEIAARDGRIVFVGVPLSAAETRGALARLDDAGGELAARILAARLKKKRRPSRR
jgi:hypothetical protein